LRRILTDGDSEDDTAICVFEALARLCNGFCDVKLLTVVFNKFISLTRNFSFEEAEQQLRLACGEVLQEFVIGCEGDEFASIVSDVAELSVEMLTNDVPDIEASGFLLFASVLQSSVKVVSPDIVSAVLAPALDVVAAAPPRVAKNAAYFIRVRQLPPELAACAFEALAHRLLADEQRTTDVLCMWDTMLATLCTLNEVLGCVTIDEFVERFEAALPAISDCDELQVIYQYLCRGWDEAGQDTMLRLFRCFAEFASAQRTTSDFIKMGVIEFGFRLF
jgi:hypothetical protein